MSKKPNDRIFCGMAQGDHAYTINGVTYIVSSCFIPIDKNIGTTIRDRFARIITSDFTELTAAAHDNKMSMEYVCSAAGEED